MNAIAKLPVIAGVEITQDEEGRFNLNALHRASGTKVHKKPSRWLEQKSTRDLISELVAQGHNRDSALKVNNGGANQGTFAHELIAISYAGWISPKFQLQVNQVFLDYRTGKLKPIEPASRLELIDMLRENEMDRLRLEEQAKELESAVLTLKPKAEALERIATARGSMCLQDAAKTLQLKPLKKLKHWLLENNWAYIRKGKTKPVAFQVRIDQGFLEHKEYEYESEDDFGNPCLGISSQVMVTPKGLVKISELMSEGN